MAINKVSNFSDLIHRVTASCFLHPLAPTTPHHPISSDDSFDSDDDDYSDEPQQIKHQTHKMSEYLAQQQEDQENNNNNNNKNQINNKNNGCVNCSDLEVLIGEVFDAFSAMKRAYVNLQEAHCPWDPDKMRVCDAAVVAELRRIGVLRERFRRKSCGEKGRGRRIVGATLREVVAPYEAAVEELKREVKVKEVEVDNLREKLKSVMVSGSGSGGKKSGTPSLG